MALEGPSFFFARLVLSEAAASITIDLDLHQVPYISDNYLDLTLTHLTIVGGINEDP